MNKSKDNKYEPPRWSSVSQWVVEEQLVGCEGDNNGPLDTIREEACPTWDAPSPQQRRLRKIPEEREPPSSPRMTITSDQRHQLEVRRSPLATVVHKSIVEEQTKRNASMTTISSLSTECYQDTMMDHAVVARIKPKEQVGVKAILATCSLLSWACVLFVPIWKIIDTSYLFREKDDPSLFDKVTSYFSSDSSWPFAKAIDNGKDTYRVYFFIMPFVLAFLFVALKGAVSARYKITQWSRARVPRFLRKRPFGGLSVMDLMLIVATLTYSALLLWARMKRSLTRGAKKLTYFCQDSKEELDPFSWEGTEVMAKTLGVLSIVLLAWFVLMPVGRRSVLLEVFGIPWDVAVKYHRWLGWYTLVVFLAHTFVYIAVWAKANGQALYDPDGNLLRHMMVPGSCNDGSCDTETEKLHVEMMYGFGSLFVMIFMSIFAIEYVRRRYFELFYYTHQLFRLMIIFLCFHYGKTMLYLLPGIVMILIDKTIGYIACFGSTKAASKALTKDIIELRIPKDPTTYCEAGQYVFVNVPAVSVLQWHPITVTWATETEVAIHIKSRGEETWTQHVFDHVWSRDGYTNVKMDGFYGSNHIESLGLMKREAVMFFCGGCAITFPFNIIKELCSANATIPVSLTWVTRTREEYSAFKELLLDLKQRCGNLSVSVWITLSGQPCPGDDFGGVDWSFYNTASTPSASVIVAKDDSQPPTKFWRPFATWLWPMYVHAAVTALAIVMGCLGYSLSRKHDVNEDRAGETRALLFDRLLDYLIVVAMASGCLYALFGLRYLWAAMHGSGIADKSPSPSTSQESSSCSSSEEDAIDIKEDDVESGARILSPYVGERPNMNVIFDEVASKRPTNVAILSCGPEGLVNAVKDEYEPHIKDGWILSTEEWEW